MHISGYRIVWLIVLFDLPTKTKKDRKRYAEFRKSLLKDGFRKMQFSVYIRSCPSEENAEVHIRRVKAALPPMGEVRILRITDKQFARMQVFYGKIKREPEKVARQLEFF